jgi:putative DNA primase/helicase
MKTYDGDAIIRAFGGKRYRKGWLFHCPVPSHRDRHPSCFMWRDGAIKCFADCPTEDVIAALDAAGFIQRETADRATFHQDRNDEEDRKEDIAKAHRLWNVFAWAENPGNAAVVENYLKSRAITLPMPNVMRRFGPDGYIAALQQPDGAMTAVFTRRFYHHGFSHGWMGRCAVQLAPPLDGQLGLAEGIETALSAMQLTNIPVWAVLGCWRLHQIFIPSSVKLLHLFADNDAKGRQALERAAKRYTSLGFNVRKRIPVGFKDYNDILKAQVSPCKQN